MPINKFNWDAQDYAKNSSAQLKWASELIERLALQGDESLLDIGCGDGKITAKLSQTLSRGKVVGIDVSRDMIELASKNFPQDQYPNLIFKQMDATAISLSENFDIAFSNATLHWVKDQMRVLKGTKAVLKRSGKILFQMGGRGNADEVFQIVNKITRASVWQKYFDGFKAPYHFYGSEEYRNWLIECGFNVRRAEVFPKDMVHQGEDGLKGWLRTTWFPYTDQLPEELRDIFLNEVIDMYLTRHPIDDAGNTHVKMVRLEVEADMG